jgi:hypothetical protein
MSSKVLSLACLTALTIFAAVSIDAQRRDYLTDAEIELVRDAQEIDLRIAVLTNAADRRFLVLEKKSPAKESEKWGPAPKGTRLDLLTDIQKIIQKAIDDIDDVAARKPDDKLFPKAVWKLNVACVGYQPRLRSFLDAVVNEKERGSILTSLDLCEQVIEAAPKVPKEPSKTDRKKQKEAN